MADSANGVDPHSSQSFASQLEWFRQCDTARDKLLHDMVDDLKQLEARYRRKCDDYEAEQEARRLLQENIRGSKRELNYLRGQTERDQFALALIDGDGLIFQRALLSNGIEGGSEAAHLLLRAVRDHLHSRYENAHSYSIMVHIVANFEGLSRKLASVGILRSPSELQSFARAFSCNQPLFSFVDVGMGKERADHKIREMFRLFLSNVQCKHIIFGGCHDNGYITSLEPYKHDSDVSRRITLLESTPAQPGFRNLGYEIISFPSVFRSDPLPESRPLPDRAASQRHTSSGSSDIRPQANSLFHTEHTAANLAPSNVFSSSIASTPGSSAHESNHTSPRPSPAQVKVAPAPNSRSKQQTQVNARAATVPGQSPAKPAVSQTAAPASWAAVGNNDTSSKTINIAPTKPIVRKFILLNGEQHRVDTVLPKADESASRNIQSRIKQQKLCNTWHLNNKCSNGSHCDFAHEPRLTPSERNALRHKARELPCYKLGSCRDYDCTSGHHCPRGPACESYTWCKYNDQLHAVSTTVKLKEYEDGDVDVVH